jgi:hypothetical protein
MPSQRNLFESVPTFDRQSRVAKIRTLAERKIFIGTSSWRYEEWLGQVYTPERYFTRGKFSKKKFHEESIQEYAETFPIIGGDFSFYSIPEAFFWQKLFARAPQHLKWDLKIPEDVTTKRFSNQRRCGPRAGHENPTLLDADAFQGAFLEPLTPISIGWASSSLNLARSPKRATPSPRYFSMTSMDSCGVCREASSMPLRSAT